MLGRPGDGQRPAADDDEHDRRPGRHDRLEQLLLATQEAEVEAVAELAGRGVVGQPGALAEDDDRDLGAALRSRDGRGDLLVRPVLRCRVPASVPRPRRRRARRGARRGSSGGRTARRPAETSSVDRRTPNGLSRRAHLAQRLDVDEVAVVAEQVAGAVGDRADDRDRRDGRAPAAGRRRSRAGRSIARASVARRARASSPRGRRASPRTATSTYGSLEQPEPELQAQDRATARIEQRLVDPAVLESPATSGAPNATVRRQLGVDAGLERQRRRDSPRSVDSRCCGRQHLDAHVVRGDDAVEAPLAAQDVRRGARRDAWHGTPSTSQ